MNSSWIEEAHVDNMELDADEVSRVENCILTYFVYCDGKHH
jgi:hypothetical protein